MDAVQQIVSEHTHKNTFDDPTRTSFVALWTVFVIFALSSVVFLGQIFTSKHPDTLGSPKKRHCKSVPVMILLRQQLAALHLQAVCGPLKRSQGHLKTDIFVTCRLHLHDCHHSGSLLLRHGETTYWLVSTSQTRRRPALRL